MYSDSSTKKKQKQKQKQGTLDRFVKKTKREDASSSSRPIASSTHSNNQTQQTDSDDLQSLENESPFAARFNSQFDQLMNVILYCSVKEYRHPLVAPLLCLKFLLHEGIEIQSQGYAGPTDKGDVINLLEMLAEYDENINEDVIKKAPLIERGMIAACSQETTKAIVKDIGTDYFAILVDEYSDTNHNHPIVLCLRYVDKAGDVIERFLGITNVMDDDIDTALSLKNAVYALLEKHSLSSCNIRGQGYNGLNNMVGDFSGLRTLIKNETRSAYHTHCFTNHLQLTIAEISKESNRHVGGFFFYLEDLVNVVLVSWKVNDMLTESHFQKVTHAFEDFILEYGKCLNQKITCCGPYYKLVLDFIEFYPVILEMVDAVANETPFSPRHRSKIGTSFLLMGDPPDTIENFEYVFSAHLMKIVFEVTNELSIVLQRKDENIVAAMLLVKSVKERLQVIRDGGWETLLSSVVSFCNKNDIKVPNMEDVYIRPSRNKRDQLSATNLNHFQVEVFFATIDLQLQELNSRFDEVVMELLVCMDGLSPNDSFRSFDKQKLLRLATFYPDDFSSIDLRHLNDQLDNYICDVRKDERFIGLKGVKELSKKLVEVKKHQVYDLVYLLIKLVLILPVATASVERGFKGLGFVTKELQSKVSDELLNDRAVTYIERDLLSKISNDDIISNFESMKTCQE